MEIELKSLHSTSTTTRKNWNEEKEKNESKATSLSYNSKNDDDGRKIVKCTRYQYYESKLANWKKAPIIRWLIKQPTRRDLITKYLIQVCDLDSWMESSLLGNT